ncbi:MAG: DUF1330 domain-containing protein, partial [Gammaproteobacteria bacterium]|nr:DUF1330 domain-containing protein [Gammaproteobacteria bacterium]
MSRGLTGFLIFLAMLVVLIGGAALYLGPNGLAFVLHDERKTAPFVMVDLLEFASQESQGAYAAGYTRPMLEMVESVGGRALWHGRVVEVMGGAAADRWPFIELIEYPSRAAYIDMVTSAEYRALLESRD